MAVNIGPKIGIDGEAQYRAELQNIIQQAKTLDAQMREVSTSFDDVTKSQDAAAKASELHAKQIEVQQARVDKLAEMVDKSSEATGENSTQTLKWQEALADAQAELNRLEGSTEGATDAVDDMSDSTGGLADKLKGGLGAAAKVGAAAIAAVAAATAAMVAGIAKAVTATADYGDEVDKESQKLGISTKAYQEWSAVLKHSGSDISALKAPMKNLAKLAAEGSESFQKLGISQKQAASMSQEDLFAAVIEKLQGMEEGTEKAALAQELLGRSAQELGPLLNSTAAETQAMKDRVNELGGVMSEESIAASVAFKDSLQDLETAFFGLQSGLASEFLPGVTEIMDGLTAIFAGDSEGGIQQITSGVHDVIDNLSASLPEFLNFGIDVIGSIGQAILDNLPDILESGGEIVGELVAGLLEHLPDLLAKGLELIGAVVSGLQKAWPDILAAGKDLVSKLGEGITNVIDSAKRWGKDLIDNFVKGVKDKIDSALGVIKDFAGGIAKLLGFSEPEEGPLSNFHTFAPDMMMLFAKGIKDTAHVAEDAMEDVAQDIADTASGISGRIKAGSYAAEDAMSSAAAGMAGAAAAGSRTLNYGGINITVYGAEGQDVRALAYEIMDVMQAEVDARRAAVA